MVKDRSPSPSPKNPSPEQQKNNDVEDDTLNFDEESENLVVASPLPIPGKDTKETTIPKTELISERRGRSRSPGQSSEQQSKPQHYYQQPQQHDRPPQRGFQNKGYNQAQRHPAAPYRQQHQRAINPIGPATEFDYNYYYPQHVPQQPPLPPQQPFGNYPQPSYPGGPRLHQPPPPPQAIPRAPSVLFFSLKSGVYNIIAQAKLNGSWPARNTIAEKILHAAHRAEKVYILISLEGSGYFQAAALVDLPRLTRTGSTGNPDLVSHSEKYTMVPLRFVEIADVPFGMVKVPDIFMHDRSTMKDGIELDPNCGYDILDAMKKLTIRLY